MSIEEILFLKIYERQFEIRKMKFFEKGMEGAVRLIPLIQMGKIYGLCFIWNSSEIRFAL